MNRVSACEVLCASRQRKAGTINAALQLNAFYEFASFWTATIQITRKLWLRHRMWRRRGGQRLLWGAAPRIMHCLAPLPRNKQAENVTSWRNKASGWQCHPVPNSSPVVLTPSRRCGDRQLPGLHGLLLRRPCQSVQRPTQQNIGARSIDEYCTQPLQGSHGCQCSWPRSKTPCFNFMPRQNCSCHAKIAPTLMLSKRWQRTEIRQAIESCQG